MNPDDHPDTALRPDAARSIAVDEAFTSLVQQLRTAALEPGADFDRCTSYLRAVETLAGRWSAGTLAHGKRGQKTASAGAES